jgi:hypothetical protein
LTGPASKISPEIFTPGTLATFIDALPWLGTNVGKPRLDIDEAIRRYSRGKHGGLINQPEAEVFFEDPIELSFENSAL